MDIFFKKRCSEKLLKIHKKMPLSEFHFHQFVSCSSINLLKNNSKLRYRCFRVNNAKYFIAVFLHNTYEQLLLNLAFFLFFLGVTLSLVIISEKCKNQRVLCFLCLAFVMAYVTWISPTISFLFSFFFFSFLFSVLPRDRLSP